MSTINHSKVMKYPTFGNGLSATKDLAAGDIIIRIDKPYLAIVENVALDRVCSQCLYQKESLKRCTGCKTVQYCSPRCQSKAWKASHKVECGIYKKLHAIPATPVRGLMELLVRKELDGESSAKWAGLEGHADSLKKQKRWKEIMMQAKASVEFTDSPSGIVDSTINILCRMTTNAFRLTLADNTPVGLCFEPIVSFANHSCTPNATVIFDGRRMELRALDHISKDEQIFISYIDPTQPTSIRQEELSSRYFFTCECEKCVQDDGPYATFLKAKPVPLAKADKFISGKGLIEFATAQCQEKSSNSLTIRDTTKTSRPAIPPTPTILHDLYLTHLDQAHYLPALILLLYIYINCDVYLYPQPHHPIRVIRLFTIARLLKTIASLQAPSSIDELLYGVNFNLKNEVMSVLSRLDVISAVHNVLIVVSELVARSHGSESAFAKEVMEEVREVEDVQRQRGIAGQRLNEWEGLKALGDLGQKVK